MAIQKLALIGCGTVGQGLLDILYDKQDKLKEQYGYECSVVAIADQRFGSVYDPEGINLRSILHVLEEQRSLEELMLSEHGVKGLSAIETITETNADVICEATYTDIKTGGPALDHHRIAFGHGKHVVTTNKGPVVVAYEDLRRLAEQRNCFWGIEGTVISGTPIIKMISHELAGCDISEISGIFNGTTNYMLTEMGKGLAYDEALAQAQELGYAEADPTADVEGHDVLAKVVILANVIFKAHLSVEQVACEGITQITPEQIEQAREEGKVWKLLGRVVNGPAGVQGEVKPVCLEASHPLAGVSGATNALTVETDLLGKVTVSGPGAGKLETGYALLSDLLALHATQQ